MKTLFRKTLTLLLSALLLMTSGPLPAQAPDEPLPKLPQGSFPDWMDKVSVPGGPGKPNLDPVEPIDPSPPAANQPTSQDSGNSTRPFKVPRPKGPGKFIPPNMPDFSKFRKMGTRTTYQKTASGSDLSSTETFEVTNLDQEEKAVRQLTSACQALPAGPERDRLEQELYVRQKKINDLKELENVGNSQATSARKIQDKARQMQQIATPSSKLPTAPSGSLFAPPPAATVSSKLPLPQPATPTYKIPDQFYRPERPTSLYLERRREAQDNGN